MTGRTLAGSLLMALGAGFGAAEIHFRAVPSWPLAAIIGTPIVLGALLFDFEELGPLAQKALSRWTGGKNGVGNG